MEQQQQDQAAPHPPISIVFRGAELQLHDAATFAGLLQQVQQQLSESNGQRRLAEWTLKLLLPSRQHTGHSFLQTGHSFLPVQALAADGASLASQGWCVCVFLVCVGVGWLT
jgi:hypothetical protein